AALGLGLFLGADGLGDFDDFAARLDEGFDPAAEFGDFIAGILGGVLEGGSQVPHHAAGGIHAGVAAGVGDDEGIVVVVGGFLDFGGVTERDDADFGFDEDGHLHGEIALDGVAASEFDGAGALGAQGGDHEG